MGSVLSSVYVDLTYETIVNMYLVYLCLSQLFILLFLFHRDLSLINAEYECIKLYKIINNYAQKKKKQNEEYNKKLMI